jgi:hypothetical protein
MVMESELEAEALREVPEKEDPEKAAAVPAMATKA